MDIENKLKNLTSQLVAQNPELGNVLEQVEGKPFEEQVEALVPVLMGISKNLDLASLMDANDIIYTNDQGTERLNPKYEAYLAERLQFDGDAPELRTGELPKGQQPAVPVETSSRNPVLIGAELEEASEKILEQFRLSDQGTALSYPKGKQPLAQKVGGLSAKDYFALSPMEKKTHTWKFISTTQGRVSAVPVISDVLLEMLTKKKHEVSYGEGKELIREHSWTMTLHDGANSTQSNFSYIDIVVRAFLRDYESGVRGKKITIEPINRVADRLFGWKMCVWDRL